MNEKTETTERRVEYRPSFNLYHPNPKGTGCAISMRLYPAQDDEEGYVMLELACQKSIGDRRGPTPTYPTFDWENRICVKLGFADLCALLTVFRGEAESINGDKGLYHSYHGQRTRIVLRHLVETVPGYSLEVYRSQCGTDEGDLSAHIFFSSNEAYGIMVAMENVLGLVCFGIPRPYEKAAKIEKGAARRAEEGYAA